MLPQAPLMLTSCSGKILWTQDLQGAYAQVLFFSSCKEMISFGTAFRHWASMARLFRLFRDTPAQNLQCGLQKLFYACIFLRIIHSGPQKKITAYGKLCLITRQGSPLLTARPFAWQTMRQTGLQSLEPARLSKINRIFMEYGITVSLYLIPSFRGNQHHRKRFFALIGML